MRWKQRIDVNQYLGDETLPVRDRASRAIEMLDRHCMVFGPAVPVLDRLIEGLRDATAAEDWDRFDEVMEQVYQVADKQRISLGWPGA